MQSPRRAIHLLLVMSMMATVFFGSFPFVTARAAVAPEITWDFQSPVVSGVEQIFSVTATNPDPTTSYTSVLFQISIDTITSSDITLWYEDTDGSWLILPVTDVAGGGVETYFGPSTGFPMSAGYEESTQFKVVFNATGSYPADITLVDLTTDNPLATINETIEVVALPSLEHTFPASVGINKLTGFSVTATNPTDGASFTNAFFTLTIPGIDLADIAALEYDELGVWKSIPLTQDGANVTGYFGPTIGFPMPAGYTATTDLRIRFASAGEFTFQLELVDLVDDPLAEPLASLEMTVEVLAPDLSSDLPPVIVVDEVEEFTVTAENLTPVDYTKALFNFRILNAQLGEINSFEYSDGTNWYPLPLAEDGEDLVGYFGPTAGFLMEAGYIRTTTFRISINTPKAYQFNLSLVDLVGDPAFTLATLEKTSTVIELPTILANGLSGYKVEDRYEEFSVLAANPSTGIDYESVLFEFILPDTLLADITSLEYDSEGTWLPLPVKQVGDDVVGYFGPSTDFPMPAGYSEDTMFRVRFATTGDYSALIQLVDLSTSPEIILANLAEDFTVVALPEIEHTFPASFGINKLTEFSVTTTNPTDGIAYTNAFFTLTIPNATTGDIAILDYFDTVSASWLPVPLSQTGDNVTGYFGPTTGFPMSAPYDATTNLRVRFAQPGDYTFQLELVDLVDEPLADPLASLHATVEVLVPTLESDLPAVVVVDEVEEFTVTATNPTPVDYMNAIFYFRILNAELSEINSLEYSDGTDWYSLPLATDGDDVIGYFGPTSGFPMLSGHDETTNIRISLNNSRTYDFQLILVDQAAEEAYLLSYLAKSVTVIDEPTLITNDLPSVMFSDQYTSFHISAVNPSTGIDYSSVLFKFTLPNTLLDDIDSLEYDAEGSWLPLPLTQDGDDVTGYFGPSTGFSMPAGYSEETQFRVRFNTVKDYSFTANLVDLSTSPETVLATLVEDFIVVASPVMSDTFPASFGIHKLTEFSVTATNPADGASYTNIRFNLTIPGIDLADIAVLEYSDQGVWKSIPLTQNGGDVTGYFGPLNGFPMPADYTATTDLRVRFASTGEYTFQLEMVDLVEDPLAEPLTSLEKTISVVAPQISINLPIEGTNGVSQLMDVQITNPAEGADYTNVRVAVVLENTELSEIDTFEVLDGTEWKDVTLQQVGDNVVVYYGPESGFSLLAGAEQTIHYRIVFTETGSFQVTASLLNVSDSSTITLAENTAATVIEQQIFNLFIPAITKNG